MIESCSLKDIQILPKWYKELRFPLLIIVALIVFLPREVSFDFFQRQIHANIVYHLVISKTKFFLQGGGQSQPNLFYLVCYCKNHIDVVKFYCFTLWVDLKFQITKVPFSQPLIATYCLSIAMALDPVWTLSKWSEGSRDNLLYLILSKMAKIWVYACNRI